MQIKFLQTKTALAWLTGVITSNEMMKLECHAMLNNQGYSYEEESRHRYFQKVERDRQMNLRLKEEKDEEIAEAQKIAFRDALREHDQEQRNSRYQQAVRTGLFTDDAEGQEFKEIYKHQLEQEKIEREKQKKLKQEKEEEEGWIRWEAPKCMKIYKDTLSTFDESERELWEKWDKERNWRQYCEIITYSYTHRISAYDPDIYYHYSKPKKNKMAAVGTQSDSLEKSVLAKHRLADIVYFAEHKIEVPNEIRAYKDYREQQFSKWKKNKEMHKRLFPRNSTSDQRCIIS